MSNYLVIDQTAPDSDQEVTCPGCRRLTMQISNQAIVLTFGFGVPPRYDEMSEPYLPVVGELVRRFDAFKFRAKVPASQLPAGATPAHVTLTPRPS